MSIPDERAEEIALLVGRRFPTFGVGSHRLAQGSLIAAALADEPLTFCAGVDVRAVVALVLSETEKDKRKAGEEEVDRVEALASSVNEALGWLRSISAQVSNAGDVGAAHEIQRAATLLESLAVWEGVRPTGGLAYEGMPVRVPRKMHGVEATDAEGNDKTYENEAVTLYWLEHYTGAPLCELCDNSGMIRKVTEIHPRTVFSASWCICPNGQKMRYVTRSRDPFAEREQQR